MSSENTFHGWAAVAKGIFFKKKKLNLFLTKTKKKTIR